MARYIRLSEGVTKGFEQDMVNALSVLGYKAMMDAYKRREFKHRTRNLHDSYGSAVFVKGRLLAKSKRYLGGVFSRAQDPYTHKTGRETLDDYFNNLVVDSKEGEIVLVVVAAMYYADYLESGYYGRGKKQRRKKQVISVAQDYIKQNYWSALSSVFKKYGIKEQPKTRVIAGRRLVK
jgi:hypothetical protein